MVRKRWDIYKGFYGNNEYWILRREEGMKHLKKYGYIIIIIIISFLFSFLQLREKKKKQR